MRYALILARIGTAPCCRHIFQRFNRRRTQRRWGGYSNRCWCLGCGPFGIDRVTMGRTGAATPEFHYNGYISRVLVYSTPLNATQREEVAAWAAANYGTQNAA